MISFWVINQGCPFQPLPNLWHTVKNDDTLCHKYDVRKENFVSCIVVHSLCTKFHVKNIYQMFLQILEFLFYSSIWIDVTYFC